MSAAMQRSHWRQWPMEFQQDSLTHKPKMKKWKGSSGDGRRGKEKKM